MNKNLIWFFNIVLAIAIVVMLSVHFRKPSVKPYFRRLHVVAESVQEYRRSHGEMPQSLSDLSDPDFDFFRGNAISYSNTISNFTLSIPFPFEYEPSAGSAMSLLLPEGSRHVKTILSVNYSIEK